MPTRRDFLVQGALLTAGALAGCAPRTRGGTGSAIVPASDARWSEDAIAARVRGATIASRTVRAEAHGARSGEGADARRGIQAALDAAASQGGGRVALGPGTWRSDGPIVLRSGTALHLEAGATLRFTPDPALYLPVVFTRWEGTECWNYSPFIYAIDARDVAITGAGTIDGAAGAVFGPWRDAQGPAQQALRRMGAEGTPVRERVFGAGRMLRPDFVQFVNCDGVTIEGITVTDSPFWVLHPTYCRNVLVRGVTVRSPRLNNDGVDPDSCTDVLIERCTFETGDDAIAIKSGRDADAWRVGRATEGVVVRDCAMPRAHNGIAIGSEMSGGVRHVHVARCTMGTVGSALYFKGNLDRGGEVSHVRVRDVTVASATTLVHFTTAYHGYRGGNRPPRFHDFHVRGVRCDEAQLAVAAVGAAGAPLSAVRLGDFTVARARTAAEIRHVRALALDNVTVNGTALASAADVDG
ncbi:MAG: glycoside hydrolase family 28 protein [Gemmatimonadaceae bacterium]|nr:glycoside hydrolase family 28 protein [Gemmatimonadaceae bacterium]